MGDFSVADYHEVLSRPCWFGKFLNAEERFLYARAILKYPDGIIQTVDLSAVHQEKNIPVLLAPGWGGSGLGTYQKTLLCLAEKRRMLAFSSLYGIGSEHAKMHFGRRETKELSAVYIKKAAALFETARFHRLEKIDAIGYSEGAMVVALAASFRPELFRNVVFVNPAGISGKTSEGYFLVRYLCEVANGLFGSLKSGNFFRKVSHVANGHMQRILADPGRTREELRAAAEADLFSEMKIPLQAGVKFSAALAMDDNLFPPKHFYERAPKGAFKEVREIPGRHSNFIYGGAEYLDEMLRFLERE